MNIQHKRNTKAGLNYTFHRICKQDEKTVGERGNVYILVDDDNVSLEPRVIFTQSHLNIDGIQDLNTNCEEVLGPHPRVIHLPICAESS